MKTFTTDQQANFTRREQEILYCIAEGLSSKAIAQRLAISEHTVSNHRKNMLTKTGARTSAEMVQLSISRFVNTI